MLLDWYSGDMYIQLLTSISGYAMYGMEGVIWGPLRGFLEARKRGGLKTIKRLQWIHAVIFVLFQLFNSLENSTPTENGINN